MDAPTSSPYRVVIARSPYRVSFAGGGTDMPGYYGRYGPGAVFSAALDAYIYISVSRPFLPQIRLAYSRVEQVASPEELRHGILREVILQSGVREHLEITTTGEIPGGSGLGSSSSLAVGALMAMHHLRGQTLAAAEAAALACTLEIDRLGRPIGKQDQYAAAFGGINLMRFHADERVEVLPVPEDPERRADFEKLFLLFHTGQAREADALLRAQNQDMTRVAGLRTRMAAQAEELHQLFLHSKDWESFGAILDEGWRIKRSLHPQISLPLVDAWYESALQAGAWGGKLLGAGNGGFLIVMAPPERHQAIRDALGRPPEQPFAVATQGAHVFYSASTNKPVI